MSIDAEAIADRRRLRRKLSFWRVAGFSGLIAAVAAIGYAAADRAGYGAIQNQIAVALRAAFQSAEHKCHRCLGI